MSNFSPVTFEHVKQSLARALKLHSTENLYLHTKLKEDLGLDSMTSLTFLMELENAIQGFYVDPESLEMDDLETIESVCCYVAVQAQVQVQVEQNVA